MKDKDPIRVAVAQAWEDGRIRNALVVNSEGIAVQTGDRSAPEGWFISQEVPDEFVERLEARPAAIEVSSSMHLVHPTVPVLSIGCRTARWMNFIMLPLIGNTAATLLQEGVRSGRGLRLQLNADSGELAMQVPFADLDALAKAQGVAELRGDSTVRGHESLVVLFAAYDQLQYGSEQPVVTGGARRKVIAATVELPETFGALMMLKRSLLGQANH